MQGHRRRSASATVGLLLAFALGGALAGATVGYTIIRPSDDDVRAVVRTIVPDDTRTLDTFTSGSDTDFLRPPFNAWIEFTDDHRTWEKFVASIEQTAIQADWAFQDRAPKPAGAILRFHRRGLAATVYTFESYAEIGLLARAAAKRDPAYARAATLGPAALGAALVAAVGAVLLQDRGVDFGAGRASG